MTQKEMVLRHLSDCKNITAWEAIKEYGITRLSAIIYELKKEGYNIADVYAHGSNRYGNACKWKVFSLIGQMDLFNK